MTPTTVRTTHLGTPRELRNGSTKSIFHGTWPLTMPLLHRWDDVDNGDDDDIWIVSQHLLETLKKHTKHT